MSLGLKSRYRASLFYTRGLWPRIVPLKKFAIDYWGNEPHPLAAMFFYESGQKCNFGKAITQQLYL